MGTQNIRNDDCCKQIVRAGDVPALILVNIDLIIVFSTLVDLYTQWVYNVSIR